MHKRAYFFQSVNSLQLALRLVKTQCVCEGAMIRTANNLAMVSEFQLGKTFICLCGCPPTDRSSQEILVRFAWLNTPPSFPIPGAPLDSPCLASAGLICFDCLIKQFLKGLEQKKQEYLAFIWAGQGWCVLKKCVTVPFKTAHHFQAQGTVRALKNSRHIQEVSLLYAED